MSSATGGGTGMIQTRFKATPPEKGSFPLDHLSECKEQANKYLECLRDPETSAFNRVCKPLAKEYLMCRMNKGLMKEEDPTRLGFKSQYSMDDKGREMNHDLEQGRLVLPESRPDTGAFVPFLSSEHLVPAAPKSK